MPTIAAPMTTALADFFQGPVTMVSCRSRKQISSAAVEAAIASTTDSANSAGS